MRFLKNFIWVALLAFVASCGGSAHYNAEECAALVEKINSKEALTEQEHTDMIEQFGAIVSWMAAEKKAAGGDEAKFKEALSTEEGKKKAEYLVYFGLELENAKDELSASNVAHLAKYMKEMKELQD